MSKPDPDYDEIVTMLEEVPVSWLPALFFKLAHECKHRGVFADGREAQVVGETLNDDIKEAVSLLFDAAEYVRWGAPTLRTKCKNAARKLHAAAPAEFPPADLPDTASRG